MADIAVGVLFVLACASLYGLAVYLFRDQIWPEKYNSKAHVFRPDKGLLRGAWHLQVEPPVVLTHSGPALTTRLSFATGTSDLLSD